MNQFALTMQRIAQIEQRLGVIRKETTETAGSGVDFEAVLNDALADSLAQGKPVAPEALIPLIEGASQKFGVPAEMIHAVIQQESGYNPKAVSPVGAQGLMQLMPATARGLGVTNSFDAAQNIEGGTQYLRQQYDKFGDWNLALAAYNAGPGAVSKYGGVPPYPETQNYVNRVQQRREAITAYGLNRQHEVSGL